MRGAAVDGRPFRVSGVGGEAPLPIPRSARQDSRLDTHNRITVEEEA